MSKETKQHQENTSAEDKGAISPTLVRQYIRGGLDIAATAARFDMLPDEFQQKINSEEELQRAVALGNEDLRGILLEKLFGGNDMGLLLLNARRFLKLEDPLADILNGNNLKLIFSKTGDGIKGQKNFLKFIKSQYESEK